MVDLLACPFVQTSVLCDPAQTVPSQWAPPAESHILGCAALKPPRPEWTLQMYELALSRLGGGAPFTDDIILKKIKKKIILLPDSLRSVPSSCSVSKMTLPTCLTFFFKVFKADKC